MYLEEVVWGELGGPHRRAKLFPAGLGFSLKNGVALYFYKVNKETLMPGAAKTVYVFKTGADFQPWRQGTFSMTPYREKIDLVETTGAPVQV